MHVAKLFMAFLFKSASKSAFLLLQQYFAKNCKQAQGAPATGIGPPSV